MSPGRQQYRASGVITIYLALSLILTSALIFTLTESARVSSLNARLQSITFMACDSLFSEFAQPVFDRYGVMLLWSSEEDFLEKFGGFCEENLVTSDPGGLIYSDIYRASFSSASMQDKISPMDKNGEVFAEQVYEYMRIFLAEDAAARILDNVSIFDQGDKVNDFMDKIESFRDAFTKVEDSVSTIRDRIDSVKSIAQDPIKFLDEAAESINSYKEGDSGAPASFRSALSRLKKAKTQLQEGLSDITEATGRYYEYTEEAKSAISELEGELEVDKEDFSEEVYEVVSEQVEDIRQKSADTDFDYYLAGSNLETTSYYEDKLGSLDSLLEATSDPLNVENADSYQDLIGRYKSIFSDFNLDALGVNLDKDEVEKEDDSFLDTISSIVGDGLLGFIAGEVSEKTVDKSGFPSGEGISDDSSEGSSLLSATADKALFGEYILQHFANCVTDKEGTALDYETEYIIAGQDSDRANLSAVTADIVLLRTGCNLISILKSSAKKAETYALATSLVGFTGMPVVIKVFQILVMAAWALGESIADVKALIEGHKIKTIKDDTDWYLSLSGIKNFGSDKLAPSGSETGLSYESYLRLLLLMQNRHKQYLRTMDIIQANMCLSENEDFRISECMTGVTIQAEYSAAQFFITFPFVSSVAGSADGEYSYSLTQDYSY